MKTLQLTFVSNNDATGDATFTQLKRTDKVALYKRVWNARPTHVAYEAFEVKVIQEGAALPGGNFVKETYEVYPGANAFGKTAYCCATEWQGEARFDELVKRINDRGSVAEDVVEAVESGPVVKGKRGRPSVSRPAVIVPETEKFTMKEILALNPSYTQPSLYLAVKADSRIKAVGTQANSGGRGKPSVLYGLVK